MSKNRDSAMARIAASLTSLQSARDFLMDALGQFVMPVGPDRDEEGTDDADGGERRTSLDNAFMCCHDAAVAIQRAQADMDGMTEEELAEGEPADDGDEEG